MVQLNDDGINGQDHKGQVVIYHAQHHGALGVHHGEKLQLGACKVVIQGDNTQLPEELIQQAVVLQNRHPGIGAQQKVHPHGQHNQHIGHALKRHTRAADKIGHGIADQQTDGRGDQGQLEGAEKHLRIGAHLGKVIQRKAAGGGGKGVDRHNDDRRHHENGHPHHIRHGKTGELIFHPRSPPLPGQTLHRSSPHILRSRSCSRRTYRNTRSSS